MSVLIDAAAAFLAEARSPRSHGYIDLPLPSRLDELVQDLLQLYARSTNEERAEARSMLHDQTASDCLHCFVARAATMGVRQGSVALASQGLMALVVEDLRSDYRETVMSLSIVVNAVIRLGADPAPLFEEAGAACTPRAAEMLSGILERYQKTKNSGLMGHRLYDTPDGIFYH